MLLEHAQIVEALEVKDYNASAGTGDIVSLKNYKHLTIVIQTGAWAAGTAAVTVKQDTAVTATGSIKALSFATMYSKLNTAGVWTKNTVTSNTFNLSAANTLYVIEIEADTLDVDNAFDCVRLDVGTPGANADLYGAQYILSQPRYPAAAASMLSAIID